MIPDRQFMLEAIRLSMENMKAGKGGPFGAVVVKGGKIIARGFNQVTSTNDPTAHAEVVAIRNACKTLATFDLSDCELYTSCEPCPMCMASIYWARIPRVFYANTREDAADIGFDDAFIYEELKKPIEERHIEMKEMMRPEAQEAFKAWTEKEDKISY
jgi:tRNA(Arg) A34 adenosine deaminase TadA